MAWTAPRTWTTSELVTASLMNTHLRDNLLALYSGAKTIYVPATAMTPTVTAGCALLATAETTALRPDMHVLDFDGAGTAKEYAQFTVAMPANWNNSTVTAHFIWTVAAAVTTTVQWSIQAVAISNDDTMDVAYGTAVSVTDTALNAAEDLHISDTTAAITVAGTPADSDLVSFQVYRDPNVDSMTQDARLIGVRVFYNTDAAYDA